MSTDGNGIGRRTVLRRAALAGVSCVLGVVAQGTAVGADTKMTQKDAEYQPTPKNGQSCATCEYYQVPSGCKIVLGKVSATGWCAFFANKVAK